MEIQLNALAIIDYRAYHYLNPLLAALMSPSHYSNNPQTLDNKPLLITGCSSGIGRCLALGLQQRGYPVFATVRQHKDIQSLVEAGLNCTQLDLNHSNSIQQALELILEQTNGRLYGLINNGAYGQPGAIEDLSRDALRAQFETNLFGTHELTAAVIPTMRQYNTGRIIQISSILGFIALRYRGAYNASKYALEGLSDTLRLELADTNIHVSLIEPGPITSEFRTNALRAFKQNIDSEASIHSQNYQRIQDRLASTKPVRLTLPADSILKRSIHALEHSKPKVRYPVTVPTYIMVILKRFLTNRGLDQFLLRHGGT